MNADNMLKGCVAQRWRSILWLFLILGLSVACGIKAPPQAPRQAAQPAVNDLRKSLKDDRLTLTWTVPKAESDSPTAPAGFVVYKSRTKLSDADCRGCPVFFERVADIPIDRVTSKDLGEKAVCFSDTVEKGYRYRYKVGAYSKDGVMSEDSNTVEFVY